jgi:hypothetical protein
MKIRSLLSALAMLVGVALIVPRPSPALGLAPLLLEVETEGATIAGAPVTLHLRVTRDQRLFLIGSSGRLAPDGASTILAGVIPDAAMAALSGTLQEIRVGQLALEPCGQPAPDWFSGHVVTWHGRRGRTARLAFAAIIEGCPSEVAALVAAVNQVVVATFQDAASLVDVRGGPLLPFLDEGIAF